MNLPSHFVQVLVVGAHEQGAFKGSGKLLQFLQKPIKKKHAEVQMELKNCARALPFFGFLPVFSLPFVCVGINYVALPCPGLDLSLAWVRGEGSMRAPALAYTSDVLIPR